MLFQKTIWKCNLCGYETDSPSKYGTTHNSSFNGHACPACFEGNNVDYYKTIKLEYLKQ